MSRSPVSRVGRRGWSATLARWRERLARSRQAFLIGLVVACGIEVVVDWNSTLFEINVLRGRVRDRGQSYVHILAAAVDEALVHRDPAELASLSEGVFSDEEVVYVRFVDPAGALLYERLEPEYGQRFLADRGRAFPAYLSKQMARDLDGVMHDPQGQRARMAASRWRDFPQRWNDAVSGVVARFVPPSPPRPGGSLVMFQEALRTPDRDREGGVTYAFGTVVRPEGLAGAVLVAFSMDRTNQSIRYKYLKGLGMVLFFVGLILVQNVSSRQDKLRLLDLQARYGAAKAAIRQALPGVARAGGLWAAGAVDQSDEKVDGQLFALASSEQGLVALLVDPDGEGIEAAAVALQVRQAFLARRAPPGPLDLLAEATALGEVAAGIPLSRPLGLCLVQVTPEGSVSVLAGPVGGARVLRGGRVAEVAGGAEVVAPAGIVGPLRRTDLTLAPGETLLIASGGLEEPGQDRLDAGAVAAFLLRSAGDLPLRAEALEDAVAWARGRSAPLARRDLSLLAIARTTPNGTSA